MRRLGGSMIISKETRWAGDLHPLDDLSLICMAAKVISYDTPSLDVFHLLNSHVAIDFNPQWVAFRCNHKAAITSE